MELLFFHVITYQIQLGYPGYFFETKQFLLLSVDMHKVEVYQAVSDDPPYLPGNVILSGV